MKPQPNNDIEIERYLRNHSFDLSGLTWYNDLVLVGDSLKNCIVVQRDFVIIGYIVDGVYLKAGA